jgi:agmatinase
MTKSYAPVHTDQFAFSGIRTFMRLPHVSDLNNVDLAVVGVPFDGGNTYRTGARFGPSGIRNESLQLFAYNPVQELDLFEHLSAIDYGDIAVLPGHFVASHQKITEAATELLNHNVLPIFLGGDHSVSWAILRAVAAKHGPVALVHFDAHTDLEPLGNYDHHGTPFSRAILEGLIDVEHSIQLGIRGSFFNREEAGVLKTGFPTITADSLHGMGVGKALELIHSTVKDKPAYLTFDIDFLDPAYAPGTGTPEVGGFTSHQALQLVRGLNGLNFVGFDVVEVMPPYDQAGITCLLAATLVYEMMSLVAGQIASRS